MKKKQIWLAAGIAGLLLGNPLADAGAEVNVQISTSSSPSFMIDTVPSFIYLRAQGFSISIGSPYDIVYYGNYYYIYYNGRWYRASNYHGPWFVIVNNRLPYHIRRHRWEDIRRYRDIEFRRPDSRNNRYQRNDDNRRRILDERNEAKSRKLRDLQNKTFNDRKIREQHKSEVKRINMHEHKKTEVRDIKRQTPQNREIRSINVQDRKKTEVRSFKVQEGLKQGPKTMKHEELQNKETKGNDRNNNKDNRHDNGDKRN